MILIDGVKYPNVAIIGLCSSTGPGSGKSYAAKRIIDLCHTDGKVLSLAEPLKLVVSHLIRTLWLMDPSKLAKSDKVFGNVTVRDLLIELGTNGFRKLVDKDIWVYLLGRRIKRELEAAKGNPLVLVVDDVRFLNEFDFILACGGQVFNLRNTTKEDTPFSDAGDLPPSDYYAYKRTLMNHPGRILLEKQILEKVKPIVMIMLGER